MKKRGKLSAALGVVVLAGATTVIAASPAAADPYPIDLTMTPNTHGAAWGWKANDPLCENPEISAYKGVLDPAAQGGASKVPVDSDRVSINDDRVSGSFDISGLESGFYVFEIECETDNPDYSDVYQGLATFAKVDVQKNVVGDVDDAAEFVVTLTCEMFENFDDDDNPIPGTPNEFDFVFGPQGGTQSVYLATAITGFLLDGPQTFADIEAECVVEETVDGGAEAVQIENAEFEVLDSSIEDESIMLSMRDQTVVVTNTFAAAEGLEEDDPADSEVEAGAEEESGTDESAATAVVLTPSFTG